MKKKMILSQTIILCITLLTMTHTSMALSMAKPIPLEKRVNAAETVFIGKIVDKVVDGDWVYAELLVLSPLKNAILNKKIKVVWRLKIGDRHIYDVALDSRVIATLGHKHKGRYWMRAEKFEKLDQIKLIISAEEERKEKQ